MTPKRLVWAISAILVVLAGCTTVRQEPEVEDTGRLEGILIGAPTGPRERIEFGRVREMLLSDSVLSVEGEIEEEFTETAARFRLQSGIYHFPTDSIQGYLVRRTKVGSTIALSAVVVVAIAAVAVAASSCPILYSYDGASFHPDAEPLGGATSAGLARSDLTELERIRPFRGNYRLAAVNEMEETQFVDALSLVVVDHRPDTRVLPDREGRLHLISEPASPRSATLQGGVDVRPLLAEDDGRAYTFDMESSLGRGGLAPRDSLVLEFERPEGATTAELVVRASTTLWGGTMLRQMLELWGTEVDTWYQLLDGSAATRAAQEEWALREEHFALKVWVETGAGWEVREVIVGNGPIISEAQVVPLDLRGVEGDRVRLRVDPPRGFWTIDHVAMDFSTGDDFVVHEVEASEARHDDGRDLVFTLLDRDSTYVEMPQVGNRFTMEFPVPETDPDYPERTVFARTAGYYTIHTDRSGPRQAATLDSLWLEPDFGVELSFRTFGEWQDGGASTAPGVRELPRVTVR